MDDFSVRHKQIELASAMLNFNSGEWEPSWKFLIYDILGQNILAPILSVDQLKSHNVTQHLLIDSKDREQVPDVAAIYFVFPTDENIDLICKDLSNHLYDSYYLNFISPLSRSKLEKIADSALVSDSTTLIKRVYDQYLNFIAIEDGLFILREYDKDLISFQAFNRPDASEAQINESLDRVVGCLFSVLITLNIIPIIRCPKGGPAEFIATKLNKKIRETLRNERISLYNTKELSLTKRPLLCIVDRNIDMSTPLHHAWTYQALIHDTIGIKLNKVEVNEEDSKNSKPKKSQFELDPNEQFWIEQRGGPFPEVAEAIQKSLEDYKKQEEELNNLKSTMGLDSGQVGDIAQSTAKLRDAAQSLPKLSKNKAILKKHTTVAASVLDQIKARKLDNFFEIEEKIMNRNLIDRGQLDEMLMTPDYGQPSDKYRLFLIACICDNPQLPEEELEKYMSNLQSFGCDRAPFEFVQQWKAMSKANVAQLQSSLQSSGGILKTSGMFSKLMSKGSQFVMEGVKNLVLKEHHLPLTKIVDGLMDTSSSKSREALQYLYLDPKANESGEDKRVNVFRDAILFVVGGGNYMEYQNLIDHCKSKNNLSGDATGPRRIIYGATDMMNANQFLDQLTRCI